MERSFYEGWFDFRGTRSRASYITAAITLTLAIFILTAIEMRLGIGIFDMFMPTVTDEGRIIPAQPNGLKILFVIIFTMATSVFFIWTFMSITAQRLRSIGVDTPGALIGLTFLFTIFLFLSFTLAIFPSKDQMEGKVTQKSTKSKEPKIDKYELLGGVVIIGVPLIVILLLIQIFN